MGGLMAGGLTRNGVPGRHTRRPESPESPGSSALRRICLAALVMLVVQYGLGIFLNLYVSVPASDAHAGFIQEIKTAPVTLTLHALLGLGLIGAALALLAGAVRARDRVVTALALAGLGTIGGAFAAGEAFVRNGQDSASFTMAALTGVALLCYVAALAALPARRRGLRVLSAALPASAPHREAPHREAPYRETPYREAPPWPRVAPPPPLPHRVVPGPPLTAHRAAVWPPSAPRPAGRDGDYPMGPPSWFTPE